MLHDLKIVLILLMFSFGCMSLASQSKNKCVEEIVTKISRKQSKKPRIRKTSLAVFKEAKEPIKEKVQEIFTVCVTVEQSDENGFNGIENETCYDLVK